MYGLVLALCLLGQGTNENLSIRYYDAPVVTTEVRPLSTPVELPVSPKADGDGQQAEAIRAFGRSVSRFLGEYRRPVEKEIVYVPQKETISNGVSLEVIYVMGGLLGALFLLLLVVLLKKPQSPAPIVLVDVDRSNRMSLPIKPESKKPRVVSIEERFRPEVRTIEAQEFSSFRRSGAEIKKIMDGEPERHANADKAEKFLNRHQSSVEIALE